MKLLFIITTLLCVSILAFSQNHETYSINNNGKESQIRISNSKTNLDITYSGDFTLTDDETAIESMSDGSYLRMRKDGQKLSIKKEDGKTTYKINDGSEVSSLNGNDKALLSEMLQVLIDNGFGAKTRAEKFYKKGGAAAVIKEAQKRQGDYVRSLYYESLVANDLKNDEWNLVINGLREDISSNYYKANLLKGVIKKEKLSPVSLANFFEAIKTIDSDYEKAMVLKEALARSSDTAFLDKVINISKSISSDYYQGILLKEALDAYPSFSGSNKFLSAVQNISSDYEKSGVLKRYVVKSSASKGIDYDYLMKAVNSIGGDYEKANVLKEVIHNGIKTEKDWLSILTAISTLQSDYEKANLLSGLAGNIPSTEKLMNAFTKAAKTITSDYDYGRVMRKMNWQ